MGYDLHITRKEFWADDVGEKISYEEWIKYLENDPEVIQDTNNSKEYFLYSREGEDWIFYHDSDLGKITAKNPSKDVIIKMVQIARELNAQVQGDDQEIYDLYGNVRNEHGRKSPVNRDSHPYERYVRYLYAVAFLIPFMWYLFGVIFPDK